MAHHNLKMTHLVVTEAIESLRIAWQSAVGDANLIEEEGSIGLLLCDFADALTLTPEERSVALGDELDNLVKEYMNHPMDVQVVRLQGKSLAGSTRTNKLPLE
jgi:hypothetical protein